MLMRHNYKNLRWIDVESPTKEEVLHLREEFNIPQPVSDELLSSTIRSKVDLHEGLIYLVLHFPKMAAHKTEQADQEIDFILGKDFLLTIHYEKSKPLSDFAKVLEMNTLASKRKSHDDHAGFLFFEVMKLLYRHSHEELESVNDLLHELENRIYSGRREQTVHLISKVNRLLLDFKQAVRYHLETLRSFEGAAKIFYGNSFDYYLESIIGEYNKLQSKIDGHKEILNDLRETNDSLITAKTNKTVATLTVMSFIMLHLSLIAGIFGMNENFIIIDKINTEQKIKLYNTYSKQVEVFVPLNSNSVLMYACGPTVYDFTHIGLMRKYVMDDILKRTLGYVGYSVKHVMNITDVGHLTDDADSGEDKLEKGANKSGKSVWDVAEEYTQYFFNTMNALNVLPANVTPKATDNVSLMVEMVQKLLDSGHAYQTKHAIYFDITTYTEYGKLSGQNLADKKVAVRDDVVTDPEKRNPSDFALWFFCVDRFENHTMRWESPWGVGFPGWHVECSAMATKYLDKQIDMHTGGIDHIPVHHENEIAQSMCAFEYGPHEHFVKYWLHYDFLTVDGEKMSKSKNNFYTIDDVRAKHINPVSMRLYFMGTSYRKPLNFTWDGAESANAMYAKIIRSALVLKDHGLGIVLDEYKQKFIEALADDLNTAKALAVVFEMLSDKNVGPADTYATLVDFDKVLGLNIENVISVLDDVPADI